MTTPEVKKYIDEQIKSLDWTAGVHRCSDFASLMLEVKYQDQKHLLAFSADQAEAVALALLHGAVKLREEMKK